jgi:hypothetical protein
VSTLIVLPSVTLATWSIVRAVGDVSVGTSVVLGVEILVDLCAAGLGVLVNSGDVVWVRQVGWCMSGLLGVGRLRRKPA